MCVWLRGGGEGHVPQLVAACVLPCGGGCPSLTKTELALNSRLAPRF